MTPTRHAFTFPCEGEMLVAVVTRPAAPVARGVVIVVGGPQYRVGSHRQFALLADRLAMQGHAVMRFDCRGMGDSSGEARDFEHVASDIRAAVDALFSRVPELGEVVLWGLCDGASASLLYAPHDERVSGVALLNPWVRSAQTQARTRLRHYYWNRVWSAEAWRSLLGGKIDVNGSVKSLASNVYAALAANRGAGESGGAYATAAGSRKPLAERMAHALARFRGRVLIVLAGQDLTAREFADMSGASRDWRRLLAAPRITRRELKDATHTFSRHDWRDQVAAWTVAWVRTW